jgi:hypothetical protein
MISTSYKFEIGPPSGTGYHLGITRDKVVMTDSTLHIIQG